MSDLRAAVEGLPDFQYSAGPYTATLVDRAEVLALIPEGAVLVTEESLAAALRDVDDAYWNTPYIERQRRTWDTMAAAILRHLREGT